jgi:hypothetical protein
LECGGLPPLSRRMPQESCPLQAVRYIPSLSKVRELAPAFTRAATSRIAETPARLAPLECGGLPPLSTPGRALPYQYPVGAQHAAPAAANPARLNPPHSKGAQPLWSAGACSRFHREAMSRIAETPPFGVIYFPLGSLTANAFFTFGQISRLKIISAAESWGAFGGAHPFIPVIMDTFSYSSPRSAAQPD